MISLPISHSYNPCFSSSLLGAPLLLVSLLPSSAVSSLSTNTKICYTQEAALFLAKLNLKELDANMLFSVNKVKKELVHISQLKFFFWMNKKNKNKILNWIHLNDIFRFKIFCILYNKKLDLLKFCMYVDLQLSSDHDVLYRVNVWFYSLLKLVSCILLSLITCLLIR